MSEQIISILTTAVKTFGAAHCAVPHIRLETETTSADIEINEATWALTLTLTDAAPSEPSVGGPPYSRQWSVNGGDYTEALTSLSKVVLSDLQLQQIALTKQISLIADAIDILHVTVPAEVEEKGKPTPAGEPTVSYVIAPKPGGLDKVIQVSAKVRPAR
jgi:hypothetical protein